MAAEAAKGKVEAAPTSWRSTLLAFFGLTKSPKQWFLDNHLLVFLAVAFLIGLAAPALGEAVSEPRIDLGDTLGSMRTVQLVNVVLIFLISGFRLKTDSMMKALRQPAALICACFSILIWTPLLGFVTARVSFGPVEFSYGLTLFCCVPTTLTSGAALISGCKGADRATELALMVTVVTNLLGCFTTPLFLAATLGGLDVDIDVASLLVKLVLSLLLPTAIGKFAQVVIPGAAKFSKDWKTPLTMFSNFNLVFVVWQSVSRSQETIVNAGAENLVPCIAFGILLHLVFWALNSFVFYVPKIPDMHQRRAIFLLGSQKTLPVSLAIIAAMPQDVGVNLGLMTLPCIFGHLSQLIIDAFLVDYWAKLECREKESKSMQPKHVPQDETSESVPAKVAVASDAAQPAAEVIPGRE